ncbi:MAG: UDP-N-acetylmuramate dehydrogenase [Candidatus Dojkabacteria bacterium]|nr:MAG: UDP-N-acetylmuramate dehydrogenase [Candidatus Dojkabacteria bacterium]
MKLEKNIPLKEYNTFAVDVSAKYFAKVESVEDIQELLTIDELKSQKWFILGRGSNTLFTQDFDGLVLKVELMGKEVASQDSNEVIVDIGAGEDWPEFVMWAVEQGWSGVENMAYIPGTVGAAPVQNIAAYGQSFDQICVSVEVVNRKTGGVETFTAEQCDFAYRSSAFKGSLRDKYIVTKVRMRLSKEAHFDTSYHSRKPNESLEKWLEETAERPYTPKDVATAVTKLRQFKLPLLSEYGTCGSFFTNPFVPVSKFHELSEKINELQQYPTTKMDYGRHDWKDTGDDEIVKIPAGRLLEEQGWKGKWVGNVGTFKEHSLVIVTNKEATGKEIYDFAMQMKESVKKAYDIELRSEVEIV